MLLTRKRYEHAEAGAAAIDDRNRVGYRDAVAVGLQRFSLVGW